MKDVSLSKVMFVKDHPNCDNLSLAFVANWQVVIPKNFVQRNEQVIFISPDAQIEDLSQDWVINSNISKYLGKYNRVKSTFVNDKASHGLIIKLKNITYDVSELESKNHAELCKLLKITHYVNPTHINTERDFGDLPPGIKKSDEENYQSLSDEQLHIGEEALLTMKKDGSSCGLMYDINTEDFIYFSRNKIVKNDKDLKYYKSLKQYESSIVWLSKHFNSSVAIRGELCGDGINKHPVNMCAKEKMSFFMYGFNVLFHEDSKIRLGRWKSGAHFTEINNLLKNNNLNEIKTVPLFEYNGSNVVNITMELLSYIEGLSAVYGEGVVVNGENFSYKVKSTDYDILSHT